MFRKSNIKYYLTAYTNFTFIPLHLLHEVVCYCKTAVTFPNTVGTADFLSNICFCWFIVIAKLGG